jgi:hypothetical protein
MGSDVIEITVSSHAWSDGFIKTVAGFKQFFFSSFVHVPIPLCQYA